MKKAAWLTAALLWDLPRLRSIDTVGAREFVDAMSFRPLNGEADDTDPLSVAAHGVIAEAYGQAEVALAAYGQLADSEDLLERLLGLSLFAWSDNDQQPARISAAEETIMELDVEPETQARLLSKLVSAAFNHGWDQLLPNLIEQARHLAPEGTALSIALDQEAHNLIGANLNLRSPLKADELTEYPWIRDLAAHSALSALTQRVEDAARQPWRLTFTIGAAPLNRPVAAEAQARWAGAIWLRRELQQQLAAHMLSGGAESADHWASAATLWALSGSNSFPQVIDFSEPHFDEHSADFLLSQLTRSEPVAARFDPRLLEAAVEIWDLISEETAVSLLDRFTPLDTEHPTWRLVNVLWAVLSLRVPSEWEARLEALSDEAALAVLGAMTPSVAERIPDAAAGRLLKIGHSASSLPDDAIPTLISLARRFGEHEELIEDVDLPHRAVVRIAGEDVDVVAEADLDHAIAALTEEIGEVLAESREGRGSLGSESPFATLSRAISRLGSIPKPTRELLFEAVLDSSIPRHARYDCLKILATAFATGALNAGSADIDLAAIPEAGAESFWGAYTQSQMRAAKVELAMAAGLVDAFLPQLLVLSRNEEQRVRIDAMEAATLARRHSPQPILESIQLNGLFDPSQAVAQRALDGFVEKPPETAAVQLAVADRLALLFDEGNRLTRRAIARLVACADLPGRLREAANDLRERIETDRSFEVREELRSADRIDE